MKSTDVIVHFIDELIDQKIHFSTLTFESVHRSFTPAHVNYIHKALHILRPIHTSRFGQKDIRNPTLTDS